MSEVWEYRFSYSVDVGCIYSFSPNYLPKCYRVVFESSRVVRLVSGAARAGSTISLWSDSCRAGGDHPLTQYRCHADECQINLDMTSLNTQERPIGHHHTTQNIWAGCGVWQLFRHCKVLSGRLVRIPEITRRVHWHWRCQQNLRTQRIRLKWFLV